MGGGAGRNRLLAIGLLQALDLAGDEAERLIPRGATIAGLAAIFGVAVLAVRRLHKILAYHGVFQPVIGIGLIPLAVTEQAHRRLALGRELLAASLDDPRGGVVVRQHDGAHTAYYAVVGVQRHRSADAYAVCNTLVLGHGAHGVCLVHSRPPPYFTSTIWRA